MPDRDPDVRIAIEHSIKVLSRWTIGLYLVVALALGVGMAVNRATVNAEIADTARIDKALCTFVADLEQRLANSKEFLDKHPGAEPIPGITRADILRTIDAQRRTLDSLSGLDC